MKIKFLYGVFVLVIFIVLSGCSQPRVFYHSTGFKNKEMIYSMREARAISKQRFFSRLEKYQVIFIGDIHNSKEVHDFSANIIRTLGKKYKIHFASEWFTPSDDPLLKDFAKKKIDEKTFVRKFNWSKRVGYKYDDFKMLYEAVRDSGGELYGINLTKKERRKISLAEFSKMSLSEKKFNDTLDLNVSAHQRLMAPFLINCHAPLKGESDDECRIRMYRVQVAWDEKMGQESAVLAKRVLKTPKDKLIVFVGAFHLQFGLGVNMRFARHANFPSVAILPANESEIYTGYADYVYIFPLKKTASKR